MSQPIAYSNGQFVPDAQLRVRPQDLGFMWGVTVAEQLRTFRGELFLLDEHLERLVTGLETIQVDVQASEIARAAKQVVEHNYALIAPSSDLGLTIFVTPGLSSTYFPDADPTPTIGIHSYPLPFSLWAEKYANGQPCELTVIQQVPSECWPRTLKSRSRMHYYLADLDARSRNPSARAILLDENDHVNEASTANVVAYFADEGLVSPPLESILPGVSLGFIDQMARASNEAITYRAITKEDLHRADEIFLTSTPFCLLPVCKLGKRTISQRTKHQSLIQQWSDHVGVDIVGQATAAGA